MRRPPEIFKWRSIFFLSALLGGVLLASCAVLPKHASPWYDWRSSWLSGDMGQASMIRKSQTDRAQRPPSVKKRRASREGQLGEPSIEVKSRPRFARKTKRKRPTKTTAKRASSSDRSHVGLPKPPAPPTKAARNLGLGDGSPSSEFLSAAKRLLGIRDGFLKKSFLRHLLSVAAIDLPIRAPQNHYAGAVFESLRARGRNVKQARSGDLVFFKDAKRRGHVSQGDFTAAGVVESLAADGVVVCIGWILGEVRRFRMDPSRPHMRREEGGHRRINDVIRARSLGEGATGSALAGELFLGYARL